MFPGIGIDKNKLIEELGDYLLQVIMICTIALEAGIFNLDIVALNVNKKKIQNDINDNFIPNPHSDNNINVMESTLSKTNKEKPTKQTKSKTSSKGGRKTRRKNKK